MDSHRGRKGKGFASLPCVHWRWQHRKVVLYRQSNPAASLHENRERCNKFSTHAFNRGGSDKNYVGHSMLCFTVQPIPPKASTSRPYPYCDGISSASIWQKVANYLLPFELWDICPESPYPSESVRTSGTGQHWSAGSSVGSYAEWLPQGVRCPAETNRDKCPSSSTGRHWDGLLSV